LLIPYQAVTKITGTAQVAMLLPVSLFWRSPESSYNKYSLDAGFGFGSMRRPTAYIHVGVHQHEVKVSTLRKKDMMIKAQVMHKT